MAGFPDKRWGKDGSVLGKITYGLLSSSVGSWMARKTAPLDRRLLLRTNGRFSLLGPIGAPTLLLTTTGAKSGEPRTSALLCARDGDRLILAGSNFGQVKHPAWTGNLLANPKASVTMGGRTVPALAHLLQGEEAEAAYRKMMEVAPMYQNYQVKTARAIRVFSLTAV